MTDETPPVYRFEHWTDYSFEDPDLIRFTIESLPYFPPHIWGLEEGDTDQVKIDKIMTQVKWSHDNVMNQYPLFEWFAYKHYRNDYLVAIHMGALHNAPEGKEYHAACFFIGNDENGSRDFAKNTRTAMKPVKDFMAQFGITVYREYILEGHPKVNWHKEKYDFDPMGEVILNTPHGPKKAYVYDLFAMLTSGKEYFEYKGKKYW